MYFVPASGSSPNAGTPESRLRVDLPVETPPKHFFRVCGVNTYPDAKLEHDCIIFRGDMKQTVAQPLRSMVLYCHGNLALASSLPTYHVSGFLCQVPYVIAISMLLIM